MTFFVFLVAGILHSSGNLSYLSGRGGLSSGKMKFLVQFAIRCECKRPLPLLDIEKREEQIDGDEARGSEREGRKSEARGQNVAGDRMSYVTLAIAHSPFSPFFRRLVSAALAAKFDISRAIKSNLLRRRSVPSARVISMAPNVGSESVGERANNTVDFKRSYVHATPKCGLYFQRLLLLPLAPHSCDRKQC